MILAIKDQGTPKQDKFFHRFSPSLHVHKYEISAAPKINTKYLMMGPHIHRMHVQIWALLGSDSPCGQIFTPSLNYLCWSRCSTNTCPFLINSSMYIYCDTDNFRFKYRKCPMCVWERQSLLLWMKERIRISI